MKLAPADGTALYIGYCDMVVQSPDGLHATDWKYYSEPPHGDSLNVVSFNGFPGCIGAVAMLGRPVPITSRLNVNVKVWADST